MADRPRYLIIVTHAGLDTIELFSAHHMEADAKVMYDRLESLVGLNSTYVHMIEVPETDGVTAAPAKAAPATSEPFAPVKADQIAVAAQPPIITRAKTAEEFEEETRQMLEGGNGVWRDADAPLNEAGATS